MKKFLSTLLNQEWIPIIVGLIGVVVSTISGIFGLQTPNFLIWSSYRADQAFTFVFVMELIVLFFLMMIPLYVMVLYQGREKGLNKGFPLGFALVFTLALISKLLAHQEYMLKYGISDSIWAILFGIILSNVVWREKKDVPNWFDSSLLTEPYIATSLVMLLINSSSLVPLAGKSLFVSWIDTPLLFIVFSFVGVSLFKLDESKSLITSGVALICGSSAGKAIGKAMGVQDNESDFPIAISSLLTAPLIITLPLLTNLFDIDPLIAGAWFGGTVDSTGAVIATANTIGPEAVASAAVVKMLQNIMIAPLCLLVALYISLGYGSKSINANTDEVSALLNSSAIENQSLSSIEQGMINPQTQNLEKEGGEKILLVQLTKTNVIKTLWEKFPKFVFGFIISTLCFNLFVPHEFQPAVASFSFTVGEWFSTCSFVSIAMSMRLGIIIKNFHELSALILFYMLVQGFDISITFVFSKIAFDDL